LSRTFLQRLFPRDVHHVEGLQTELVKYLPDTGRVLDLGCGVNTDLAGYRTPTREVRGTDFQIHAELRHVAWFRLLPANGAIPFTDEYFDLITTNMVLEHVTEGSQFFQEVARVLRPSGIFIGHTISGSHYVTWIRRLVGLLPHSFNAWLVRRLYGRREVDTFPAYYRLNRSRQISQACRPAGFRVVCFHRYADPGYFNFCGPLRATAVFTDWFLEKLAAGWGRLYFTVTLRKEANGSELRKCRAVAGVRKVA
jgi:SAM-dependent methyltransferase